MNLYHYFEKEKGPFVNLSELPLDEAQKIQDNLQNEGKVFAARRNPQYLSRRRYLEQLTRKMFIEKGDFLSDKLHIIWWLKNVPG